MTSLVESPTLAACEPGSDGAIVSSRRFPLPEALMLLLLTFAALLVHGYHPHAEDAEIYLPGVEKMLHPQLFPVDGKFFQSHAQLTIFPNVLAASIRTTNLPMDVVLFAFHVVSIFLLLLACWQLSGHCFTNPRARWAGVALVAALLTIPVAGTALYIADQYLNPRNIAAFAAMFAIVRIMERKFVQAGAWLVFAALFHPLMSAFAFFYSVLLLAMEKLDLRRHAFAFLLPIGISLEVPSEAYHQAGMYHSFHYLLRWQWYEWLGIFVPLILLWWFARIARFRGMRNLHYLCKAAIVYGLVCFVAALLLSSSARFETVARFQPLRGLLLLYILLFLFMGGLAAEQVLKERVWRWFAFYALPCAAMLAAQWALFPGSAHVEWPGAPQKNLWAQAFLWIQAHTPENAVFALDPRYLHIPGEDSQGFRNIAERSRLADAYKDSGAVTMFPPLAEEWYAQMQAQEGWGRFQQRDFARLQAAYGVSWVVLARPGVDGLNCPYQNEAAMVCRLD
jgi:hypothetical protein